MNIVFDDMELPCSRVDEVEIILEHKDSILLKLDSNEVQIKYMDGRWCIFCNQNVEVTQVNLSPTLVAEHSF